MLPRSNNEKDQSTSGLRVGLGLYGPGTMRQLLQMSSNSSVRRLTLTFQADYDALQSNASLWSAFRGDVVATVAKALGVPKANVSVLCMSFTCVCSCHAGFGRASFGFYQLCVVAKQGCVLGHALP